MKQYVLQFVTLFILIVLLDRFGFQMYESQGWLAVYARLQSIRPSIRTIPGVIVYLLLSIGIFYFVIPFITQVNFHQSVLIYSTLFGIVVYGIMYFTNYQMVKEWTLEQALLDTMWGVALVVISTYITIYMDRYRNRFF